MDDTLVSFDTLKKASRVVHSFVSAFFPVLGLPLADALPMHHLLLWVESRVYAMDSAVERGQREDGGRWNIDREMATLTRLLEREGLLSPPVSEHLSRFVAYFQSETAILMDEDHLTLEQLREAWWLRSGDLQLLASLAASRAGISERYESNRPLRTGLDCLMRCAEVVADIPDYQQDRQTRSFNTLRLFERLYGASAARGRLLQELASIRAQLTAAANELEPDLRGRLLEEAAAWWGYLEKLPDPTVA